MVTLGVPEARLKVLEEENVGAVCSTCFPVPYVYGVSFGRSDPL